MELEYDLSLAKNISEVVDRLITVQVAESGGGAAKINAPINPLLYNAARKAQNDEPLTYLAAKAILENVKPGGAVVLSAGLLITPYMREEVDGTFGIAGLARAIAIGGRATPIVLTEDSNMKRMELLIRAVGLDPHPLEEALLAPNRCALEILPRDVNGTKKVCDKIHQLAKPRVLVVSEKIGPSDIGVYRSGPGFDLTALSGKTQPLVDSFTERGLVTIGVGDGGNEVGMGRIKDTVRELFSGDSAAATVTDILVVAASGNLGCYGIEAVLAAAWGMEELLHNHDVERRMELASIFGGLIDPTTGFTDGWTDAMEPCVAESFITLLQQTLKHRLVKKDEGKAKRKKARAMDKESVQKIIDLWATKVK